MPRASSFGNTPTGALGSVAGQSDIYGVMVSNADGTKFKSAGGPVQFHHRGRAG